MYIAFMHSKFVWRTICSLPLRKRQAFARTEFASIKVIWFSFQCAASTRWSFRLIRSYHYPHNLQVSNLSDSIKSACDFFHINSATACQKVTAEFRQENLVSLDGLWREDVLQATTTMFYAYLEVARKCRLLEDVVMACPEDKMDDFVFSHQVRCHYGPRIRNV